MRDLLTFVILAFVTYRVARLAILDTIFDKPRDDVHAWLLNGNDSTPGRKSRLQRAIYGNDPATWRKSRWRRVIYTFLPVAVLNFAATLWLIDGHVALGVGHLIAEVLWLYAMFFLFSSGPTWLGMYTEKMISCPYCLTIWIGGGLQLAAWPWVSIPLPAVYFLALSGAGMVVYQYIDFEPEEDNELDDE